ncbi:MAG: hypothetical protein IPN01_11270 [Deltaproteobacteria bacterium]|nr:hypothetical protein [Deltaproteobacteria bacterium]
MGVDLVAVAQPVVVAVFIEGIGRRGVDLVAVAQAVVVGVSVVGVGA